MTKQTVVEDYWRYAVTERVNDPAGYIEYLKTQPRFRNCGLDRLPPNAIILHDTRVEEHLAKLGYSQTDYRLIETGTTDPNILYLVHGREGGPDFILNRGLPGAGGIATQAAELGALGVKRLVHMGTCGLVGDEVKTGEVVVAKSSYKDGAATLLSEPVKGKVEPLAHADEVLSAALRKALAEGWGRERPTVGYTIPIFYFQPLELIRDLITGDVFPDGPRVGYFEMEQASFFETCRHMKLSGASMVVGSDRYRLVDGKVTHQFESDFDQDAAELAMIRAAVAAFKALGAA